MFVYSPAFLRWHPRKLTWSAVPRNSNCGADLKRRLLQYNLVARRTGVFDDQHDCQASVDSNVLLRKPARMRIALSAIASILSALALLLIKETVFLLSEYRQASEREELAHKSTCPHVTCLEPEVAELDFEFPFLCGLGACVFVAFALVVLLRCRCSSRVEPAALRVRRVRLNHNEDAGTEEVNFAESRISDRRVVSK